MKSVQNEKYSKLKMWLKLKVYKIKWKVFEMESVRNGNAHWTVIQWERLTVSSFEKLSLSLSLLFSLLKTPIAELEFELEFELELEVRVRVRVRS